jgi:peptidoglycan hydrolase-like protein with peptidoglycan-binding domain
MGAAGAPKREMTMAMLRLGSTGNEVKKLQEGLNKALKPNPKLKPDGQFGPGTDKAVRQFQKKNKLKPDGVVGPKTMAMIDGGGKQVEMDIFDYREKKKKSKET